MRVSIVIPTLNEEANIARAINSVKNQSYKGKYEIIVSDSGSDDRTREIAESKGALVYNLGHSKGAGAGRAFGASKAIGELILFMDSDSVAHKDWIKEFVYLFGKHPKIVAASGKLYPIENDAKLEEFYCKYLLDPIARTTAFLRIPMVYGINIGVRRSVYEKVGGFGTDLVTCEDTDLAARMQKYGKIGYASKAIVYTSMRRVQNMGPFRYTLFHISNHFRFYISGSPSTSYDPVR